MVPPYLKGAVPIALRVRNVGRTTSKMLGKMLGDTLTEVLLPSKYIH